MIDWFGLFFNALWVAGLALLVAALGWLRFWAAERPAGESGGKGHSWRQEINRPSFGLLANLGLFLFCLGLALNNTGWIALLWLGLACAFAVQLWSAARLRSGASDPAGLARAWWAAGGWTAVGLVVLGALFVAAYSFAIRPWMQPDEPRHFEVVQHNARLARPTYYPDLNLEWEREIIADMEAQDFWWYGFAPTGWDPQALPVDFVAVWGQMYSRAFFQQPLYYVLTGGLLKQWWLEAPLSMQVIWLRLVGAVFFAITLGGLYAAGRELFPARAELVLAALAFAALWPSHIAAFAAVNNDALVELWVVWAAFFGLRTIRRGASLGNLTALVVLGLLAILTKRSGLVVLVLPLTLVLRAIAASGGHWRRQALWSILAALVAVAAVAGLWLAAQRTGRIWAPPDFLRSLVNGDFLRQAAQAPLGRFADVMLRSFMGWFGWLRVGLPPAFYTAGWGLVIAWAFALLLGYGHILWPGAGLERWQRGGLVFLAALLLAQFTLAVGKDIVYGFWQDGSAPQARYLYPVVPALVLPAMLGITALLRPRWRRRLPSLLIAALTLFNLYVLGFVLYPFFWL